MPTRPCWSPRAGAFYGDGAGRVMQGTGARTQASGPGQGHQAQDGLQGHLGYPQAASESGFYSAYGPAALQEGRQY
jgi:hypothetical protein